MKLKYTGAARDYSGYGEANRHDIAALTAAGIDLTLEIPRYTPEGADFGKLSELVDNLENKPIGYYAKVLHTTPNVYPQYYEPGKYHIGRVFWETDKLPEDFVKGLSCVDEIWTGSEHNKKALLNSGVDKPIYIIPQAIDISIDVNKVEPYITHYQDTYKFYSIFEWTERKNPMALLEAYWREFENDDKVSLTIKTYVDNFNPNKREEIDMQIRRVKKMLGLKRYAPVYLYRELMDRHQVYRLHKTFDCFVSAHRGEGWGLPQLEAMLMEKPIISTNCGGVHEYLSRNEAYLLDWTPTPVANNRNKQWYTGDQNWASVNVDSLRAAMRDCYSNPAKAKGMGKAGANLVRERFNFNEVGKQMRNRLLDIINPKL